MTLVDSDKRRGTVAVHSGNQLDARVHRQLRGGPPAADLIRVLVRHGHVWYVLCPTSSPLLERNAAAYPVAQCPTSRHYPTSAGVTVA